MVIINFEIFVIVNLEILVIVDFEILVIVNFEIFVIIRLEDLVIINYESLVIIHFFMEDESWLGPTRVQVHPRYKIQSIYIFITVISKVTDVCNVTICKLMFRRDLLLSCQGRHEKQPLI